MTFPDERGQIRASGSVWRERVQPRTRPFPLLTSRLSLSLSLSFPPLSLSLSLPLFLSQLRSHSPRLFTSGFLIASQLATLPRAIHRHMPDLFLSNLLERSSRDEVLREPARFRLRDYDAFFRRSCCPRLSVRGIRCTSLLYAYMYTERKKRRYRVTPGERGTERPRELNDREWLVGERKT